MMGTEVCEKCGKLKLEDEGAVCANCYVRLIRVGSHVECPKCGRIIPGVCSGRCDKGCYIATCVYGSYDCPEVWTLRRYRDSKLSVYWFGRRFIQIYYAISPKIVELFGNKKWFNELWKPILNKIIRALQNNGIESSPYLDK